VAVAVSENEALAADALPEPVGLKIGAEGVGDRDAAGAGGALRLDEPGAAVPAALDANEVRSRSMWFQSRAWSSPRRRPA